MDERPTIQIDIRVNLELTEGEGVNERKLALALCRAIDDTVVFVRGSTYDVVGIEDVD